MRCPLDSKNLTNESRISFAVILSYFMCYYFQKSLEDLGVNQKLKEMQCTFLGTGCQNKTEKYKEVIDKAINWAKDYIKQWDSEDDVISDMEILLNILKEVK